jgi:integrase/recombinase XerD
LTFLDTISADEMASWADVDGERIKMYGAYLEDRSYAPSTVARKIASVKSFFSYLLDSGALVDNPTDALDAPKVEKKLPRILTMEEVDVLLAEPSKGTTPKALRDRALLELLYATGMRVSEVITLQYSDLDVQANRVVCLGRDWKERELPLTPRALEAQLAYLEKGRDALLRGRAETMLFVNQRGRPLTRQGLWLIIKSYAEAAGLGPDITPHTLRHSCAAHRLAQGTDLKQVRELLGHANIATTQAYINVVSIPAEETDVVPG